MLKIRLARVGKRGHATFRLVVTEHTRPPKSGALEQLGSYDPHRNTLRVDAERLKARLATGVQPSPTVRNLLIEHKVLEGEKGRAWKPKRRKAGEAASAQASAPTAPPAPAQPTPESSTPSPDAPSTDPKA